MSSSSSARMLANRPDASTLGHDDECLPTQNSTWGGSSDSDVNDPMAMPIGLPSCMDVTTVTPVGKWPST
jgi:hypothetical protein